MLENFSKNNKVFSTLKMTESTLGTESGTHRSGLFYIVIEPIFQFAIASMDKKHLWKLYLNFIQQEIGYLISTYLLLYILQYLKTICFHVCTIHNIFPKFFHPKTVCPLTLTLIFSSLYVDAHK